TSKAVIAILLSLSFSFSQPYKSSSTIDPLQPFQLLSVGDCPLRVDRNVADMLMPLLFTVGILHKDLEKVAVGIDIEKKIVLSLRCIILIPDVITVQHKDQVGSHFCFNLVLLHFHFLLFSKSHKN